jgi:hypothetical protein
MKEGEKMLLLERDVGDGWTRVRHLLTNAEGFVPTSYLVSYKEICIQFSLPNLPFSQNCRWYPSPVAIGPSIAGSLNDKVARNLGITMPVPEAVVVNLPPSANTKNNLEETKIDQENGSSTNATGFSLMQFFILKNKFTNNKNFYIIYYNFLNTN